MYPEALTSPMKADLTSVGFKELTSPEAVNQEFANTNGTMLVMVNSVCGCAAGTARPGLKLAIQNQKHPDRLLTVFAGVDTDATNEARKHFAPFPPSSPAIALFKNGELVHFVERHMIEGRPADVIAQHLKQVFDHFC